MQCNWPELLIAVHEFARHNDSNCARCRTEVNAWATVEEVP